MELIIIVEIQTVLQTHGVIKQLEQDGVTVIQLQISFKILLQVMMTNKGKIAWIYAHRTHYASCQAFK